MVPDDQEETQVDAERMDERERKRVEAQQREVEGGAEIAPSAQAPPSGRPMTIEEAARKGGNTTKDRYGPDFYSRIGRKGGQRVAKERGPEFYSEIGRKGGEARVAQSKKLERERTDEEPKE